MLTPAEAWQPLPAAEWDHAAARHLALRLGYSAAPALVAKIEQAGPQAAVGAALGRILPFEAPGAVVEMQATLAEYRETIDQLEEKEARQLRQKRQRTARESHAAFALAWYAFARQPAHSPQEKLVQFFENIWVVSYQTVNHPPALYEHQDRIRRHLHGSYPALCAQLALSPAMVRYLNLGQNRKGRPNENFARELFELFTLGEGHYTENDIKEAARALTGYTIDREGEVRFVERRHDTGRKTVFGQTGRFGLPEILALIFQQPAAARFLPREMVRAYLTEEGLSDALLEPLAQEWKATGFSIPFLVSRLFTARIFYDPAFRGTMIKSPVQYYLGLLQDLELDVFPSPRRSSQPLRLMGQTFFMPPNVRGWVGGRHRINSATLAARLQLVRSLLGPVRHDQLNADEVAALERAEAEGRTRFSVSRETLDWILQTPPDQLAKSFAERFYAAPGESLLPALIADLEREKQSGRRAAVAFLVAALSAPAYHLC